MATNRLFHGWIIVAASFAIMSVSYGIFFSWPVFYVAILDQFGWGRAETALIFSTGSLLYGFASPVAGALFDRFGPRRLFIAGAVVLAAGAFGASQSSTIWQFVTFFGLMVALGACAAGFIPSAAMISNWFIKKRATALGIAQASVRDSFLFVPLIQLAITGWGWQTTYRAMAALSLLVIVPLALLLRARPQDMGLLPDGGTYKGRQPGNSEGKSPSEQAGNRTLSLSLKQPRFWGMFVVMLGAGFGLTPIINHHVAFITDMGFSAMFAAALLTVYAVACLLGRLSGFVSDFTGRALGATFASLGVVAGMVMLILARDVPAAWMLYLYVILFGYFGGMCIPAYSALAADMFQGRDFGTIFGLANVGYGAGISLGNWLFGYIFDNTGTYFLAFISVIFMMTMQIVAIWMVAPRRGLAQVLKSPHR